MKTTWSATLRAKPISWVTTTMVMPRLAEACHEVQDALDQFRVQGAGGLVEEHDFRFHGQGPGDGDALLLAAGEVAGAVVGAFGEADLGEAAAGAFPGFGLGHALDAPEGQGHVLQGGVVREEVEVLEDHADAGCAGGPV